MPPKHAPRERTWGTRYDTLNVSSPPSSPPTQRLPVSTASSIPHSPSSQHSHDTLPVTALPTPTKSEKTSHDSSIFVGSLPSNMDHNELTRLLTEHLSGYPEIKNVKVIRDSKGGVCAFAQCENASSAGRLLDTLQTTHQLPFLGRNLRFEPARAYRTLLISYRIPRNSAYPNSGLESCNVDGSQPEVGVALHTSMRLYKPRNGKYCTVVFDSEANDFEASHASQTFPDEIDNPGDPLSGSGLFISPLKFDGKTLRKIVTAFGGVEHCRPFDPNAEGLKDVPNVYCHSVLRASEMDDNIWEIKWEQREDCMNAAMTLRNVPHLTITWAHRAYPEPGSGLESRFGSPTVASSPRLSTNPRSRTQSRSHFQAPGDFRHFVQPGVAPDTASLRIMNATSYVNNPMHPPMMSLAYPPPILRAPSSPLASRAATGADSYDATLVPNLSDVEFPSLHEKYNPHRAREGSRPRSISWVYKDMPEEEGDVFSSGSALPTSPSSSLSVQPSTPAPIATLASPGPGASDSDYGYPGSPGEETYQGQELIIPLTPDFTTASVTPVTPKTALSFPHTPQSARSYGGFGMDNFHRGGSYGTFSRKDGRYSERDFSAPKEVDPFWIFAGGLNVAGPHPWDEERVRGVFEKYGEIEKMEFIRPVNNNSGFAFIKYTNTTDSANAVAAEHLRLYDGRNIRVQLREMNPLRNTQRFARNKPRPRRDFSSGYPNQFEAVGQINESPYRPFNPSQDVHHDRSQASDDILPPGPGFTSSEDALQPVFPSIAGPQLKSLPTDAANAQRRSVGDAFTEERPVSSTSGSVSSAPPSMAIPSMTSYPAPMHHQPWMQPYPSYAHPQTYGGYMGYPPMPGYQPGTHSAVGEGPVTSQYPWPYPGYMYRNPYQQQTSSGSSGDHNQTSSQHPVKPSGFVDEQGTLIAVYNQDTLNQYMSGTGRSSQSPSPPGAAPAQGPHSTPGWGPYVPGPHMTSMYPYGYPPSMVPPPTQQSLAPPGQYPPNTWLPAAGSTPYLPSHAQPPHHAAQGQNIAHGPAPPYSASFGSIAPSSSYRGSPYSFPSQSSHSDVGQGQRSFHPAGPQRFMKHQGQGSHTFHPQDPTITHSQSQGFRNLNNTRNDRGGGTRGSPPRLGRRGSRSMDVSYSTNDIQGHGQGPSTSGSQQYLG